MQNGTDAGDVYTGNVAQAQANDANCVNGGGYWYQTTAGTSASNNKYCYATGGPLGGALNGAANKKSIGKATAVAKVEPGFRIDIL